jgi:proliferating cell nuclear antigen
MSFIVEASTCNSSAIKTLSEVIKSILTEVNMVFDSDGIRMVAINKSQNLLFHLRLNADGFQVYKCKRKCAIGLDTDKFHRILKSLSDGDILTFQINESQDNELCIFVQNKKTFTYVNYRLNTLDIDEANVTIPDAHFDSVISIPSGHFQKIIRDHNNIGSTVLIKSIKSSLIFETKGNFASQETVVGETEKGLSFEKGSSGEIVQATYQIENLTTLTKCTNLCDDVILYMKNGMPIIIKYKVVDMGEVKFCLHAISNNY